MFYTAGTDHLVPDSLQLRVKVKNPSSSNTLQLQGPMHNMFDRLRITMGGALVDDISNYARIYNTLCHLQPAEAEVNREVCSGPGGAIATSGEQVFSMPIYSGVTSCQKLLPMRYCPTMISLTLSSNFPLAADREFTLEDCVLMGEVCQVDEGINDAINSHLPKSGRGLGIHINSFFRSMQAFSAQDHTANVSKACSRLRALFTSFCNVTSDAATTDNGNLDFRKPSTENYEIAVNLGSKLFPETPMRFDAERFYELSKVAGLFTDPSDKTINISKSEYTDQPTTSPITEKKLLVGLDMALDKYSPMTGKNLANGEIMAVPLKNCSGVNRLFVAYLYDTMINVLAGQQVEVLS